MFVEQHYQEFQRKEKGNVFEKKRGQIYFTRHLASFWLADRNLLIAAQWVCIFRRNACVPPFVRRRRHRNIREGAF